MNTCWAVAALGLLAAPALHAQSAIGEVFANDASVRGSVVLSVHGTSVMSGSQVSAGDAVALLKLERGGEVRICPKTNLSLTSDASGKSLVLGMNAGALEVDYPLPSASDSLLTPDFRMQLISPGSFHFAVSVSATGDTCIHSLPGNDAAIFLAEMMGTESYQLSPGKSVMFKAGRIAGAMEAPKICGCPDVKERPPAKVEEEEEKAPPAAVVPEATSASKPVEGTEAHAAPKPTESTEPHMEVESTFVYRGKNALPDDIYSTVAKLSTSTDNSGLALALLPKVSGPVVATAPVKQEKKPGVWRRFGRFMGRLFGK